MKILKNYHIPKVVLGLKSLFFFAAFFVIFFFITENHDAFALPNCSTINYPDHPLYLTNCVFPGCKSADSSIDNTPSGTQNPNGTYSNGDGDPASNCQLPNCPVPLGPSDIPNFNCMLPNCPTISTVNRPSSTCSLSSCATAETNCSLPICPPTLSSTDIPMKTCSMIPCKRPVIADSDQPGINCSLPICSNPLLAGQVPRVNCLLPTCEGNTVSNGTNCTYRPCSEPLASGDIPEGSTSGTPNCSLKLCLQPLSDTDKPGENCTLRKCRSRTAGCSGEECNVINNEKPGLDCLFPECADLSSGTPINPGVNCLYKNNLGKLVPICDGTEKFRNHGTNCMDATDLPPCTSAADQVSGKNCIRSCDGSQGEKPGINCTLPSCESLRNSSSTAVIRPGQNCLYSVNGKTLPLCKNNPNIRDKTHRINCADLIDLPLCSQVTNSIAGVNCVPLCSSIAEPPRTQGQPPLIRGLDFAIHNSDCIEFCPTTKVTNRNTSPPTTVDTSEEEYCTQKLCHHYSSDAPTTCSTISCDLLNPSELDESKFSQNSNFRYCDGTVVKCYDFKPSQLQYLFPSKDDIMCVMNNCRPYSPSTCSLRDETQYIINQGSTFANRYRQYLYHNTDWNSQLTCKQKTCIPTVKRYLTCSPQEDIENATTRNPDCDYVGDGSNCNEGVCYKTIDCNSWLYRGEKECVPSTTEDTSDDVINDDFLNSWFFRPKPMNKSYDPNFSNGKFRQMDVNNICYSGSDMRNQPETKDVTLPQDIGKLLPTNINAGSNIELDFGLFQINLGYFRIPLVPDFSHSPRMCGVSSISLPMHSLPYLCGNKGLFWESVSDETAYFSGYVRTEFQDNDATHHVKVCVRFKNFMRPDDIITWTGIGTSSETCGKRECAAVCAFGFCPFQFCGEDVCRTLTLSDSNPQGCVARSEIMEEPFGDIFGTITSIASLASSVVAPMPISPDSGAALTSTNVSNSTTSNSSAECMSKVSNDLRVRAVKYGRYICSFIDAKGYPALKNNFLSPNAKVLRDTNNQKCASFPDGGNHNPDQQGECQGYNSKRNPFSPLMWRTILEIPYIKNSALPSDQISGYINFSGKLFRKQECIKTPLRVPPPYIYNLGNPNNSYKIFAPPLYISNSMVRKGGTISQITSSSDSNQTEFGPTDFHYPEIEVTFGNAKQKLNLEIGQTGYETTLPTGAYATINSNTTPNFEVEVLARKEFDNDSKTPLFCLYRHVKDGDGAYIEPVRVGCVKRQLPEINGLAPTNNTSQPFESRRLSVTSTDGNTFSNASISLRFVSGSQSVYQNSVTTCKTTRIQCVNGCGTNDDDCINNCLNNEKLCINNCSTSSCSNSISISNENPDTPNCSMNLERHNICVQRDPCSRINYECMQNEVNLQNALSNGENTENFESIRDACNTIILPQCNAKFGNNSSQLSLFESANQISNTAYGWYNEICVVSGFKNNLRKIIAKALPNVMGKCVIDSTISPNMQSGGPGCSNGGLAPGCKCLEYIEGQTVNADEYVRLETPHEAGLCVEIPKAKTCSKINYNISPNIDSSDSNYIASSMSKDMCITTGATSSSCSNSLPKYCDDINADTNYCIHTSHKYRSNYIDPSNTSNFFALMGHAEFPTAIAGTNQVRGSCNGFWKNNINPSNGTEILPTAQCVLNPSNGNPQWTNLSNDCIRFSCPRISINDSGILQIPQSDDYAYDAGFATGNETDDNMGLWNGYATWPRYNKTDDFPEEVQASSCIVGFTAKNSSSVVNINSAEYRAVVAANPSLQSVLASELSSVEKPFHSLYGLISGRIGGTLPKRFCNQIGLYSPVHNVAQNNVGQCLRIQCPAINPATSGLTNNSFLWEQSGGATFPSANASRSSQFIESGSYATGTCNEALGYYQSSPSTPPTMKCDYLGNWTDLENECVKGCDAIISGANTAANGFAYWDRATTDDDTITSYEVTATGCVNGYKQNPYPPKTDINGNLLANANDLTRAVTLPRRTCNKNSSGAFVWGPVISPCVNSCPGKTEDSRIGVGVTKHYVYDKANNSVSESYWNWTKSNNLGGWKTTALDKPASNFVLPASQTYRTSRDYAMKRYCNPDTYKWDDPVVSCSNIMSQGTSILNGVTIDQPSDFWLKLTGVNETLNASCAPGYRVTPSTSQISLTCKQANVIYNGQTISPIDQTYFDFTTSSARCVRACELYTDVTKTTDNYSIYKGTSTTIGVGETTTVKCLDGYSKSGICGDNLDSTAVCNQDGTISAVTTNSCKPCNCIARTNAPAGTHTPVGVEEDFYTRYNWSNRPNDGSIVMCPHPADCRFVNLEVTVGYGKILDYSVFYANGSESRIDGFHYAATCTNSGMIKQSGFYSNFIPNTRAQVWQYADLFFVHNRGDVWQNNVCNPFYNPTSPGVCKNLSPGDSNFDDGHSFYIVNYAPDSRYHNFKPSAAFNTNYRLCRVSGYSPQCNNYGAAALGQLNGVNVNNNASYIGATPVPGGNGANRGDANSIIGVTIN